MKNDFKFCNNFSLCMLIFLVHNSFAFDTFLFFNSSQNKWLIKNQPHRKVVPASTQKLVTMYHLISELGPSYQLSTYLYYHGKVEQHVFQGELVLKGSGDPFFGTKCKDCKNSIKEVTTKIKDHLNSRGIKKVDGCVSYVNPFKGQNPENAKMLLEDAANYYGGRFQEVNWNNNEYQLVFSPGKKEGNKATFVSIYPKYSRIEIVGSHVWMGAKGSGDQVYIYGSFPGHKRWVEGSYAETRKEFSIRGSLPFAGWTASKSIECHLTQSGIPFENRGECSRETNILPHDGKSENFQSKGLDSLVFHSDSLKNFMKSILFRSDNHVTQQLSGHLKNKRGEVELSSNQIFRKSFLKSFGLDSDQFNLVDATGLSPKNWVSSLFMIEVLKKIQNHPSFPLFLQNLRYQEGLYFKTGTMSGVACLAGWKKKNNQFHPFFIASNHFKGSVSKEKRRLLNEVKKVRLY